MPIPKFKTLNFKSDSAEEAAVQTEINEGTGQELREIADKLTEKKLNIPFNLKMIPRNRIIFNEKNDYEQVDIEKLAEAILHFGLIHSMEGYYDEEQDLYVIESGERRTRAIDYLLNKFSDYKDKQDPDYKDFLVNIKGFESGYPINVKKKRFEGEGTLSRLDEIDSEIRLMDANEEIRPSNPQDKFKRITRRAKLIEERNNLLPYKERLNINKEVGNKLGISERQVQKYKSLNELIPELQDEFFQNNITLSEGANFALLTETEQRDILKLIQEGKKVSAEDVRQLKREKEMAETELSKKTKELNQLKAKALEIENKHKQDLEEIQEKIKEEKEHIKEELRIEILNDNPDREKVVKLEKKLKKKEEEDIENQKSLNQIEKKLSDKNKKIDDLQKELNILKAKPLQDIENIRTEMRLSTAMENTLNSLSALKREFKENIQFSEIGKYRKDLTEIIEEVNKIIESLI